MFARRPSHRNDSFSSSSTKYRAGKSTASRSKRSFRESDISASIREAESVASDPQSTAQGVPKNLTSPIITISVGPEGRMFAAHEDILSFSPVLASHVKAQYLKTGPKQITLPHEQPEVLSSILEYLYKGDYSPRLLNDKRRDTWYLEDRSGAGEVFHHATQKSILKETLIYCAAEKYSLPELKRLALRKQGLQNTISVATILNSARYAYDNTPDSDAKLRAHYLALVVRSRNTFRRSGTMQQEMIEGGRFFFDLFVAMCNHLDDLHTIKSPTIGGANSPIGSPYAGSPYNGSPYLGR